MVLSYMWLTLANVKELKQIHVNILDLIDARRAGTRVRTFRSAGEMMRYTRDSGKIMPIWVVKEDRFLSALLKKL